MFNHFSHDFANPAEALGGLAMMMMTMMATMRLTKRAVTTTTTMITVSPVSTMIIMAMVTVTVSSDSNCKIVSKSGLHFDSHTNMSELISLTV